VVSGEGELIRIGIAALAGLTVMVVEAHAVFFDGNRLYALCTSQDTFSQGVCVGYVTAAVDHMEVRELNLHKPHCLPKGVKIRQVVDTVVKFLTDYPEFRRHAASWLVTIAVTKAWHCQ
jgi:hypothetical protein